MARGTRRSTAVGFLALASASLLARPAFSQSYNPLSSTFQLVAVPDPQYYAVVQWKNDQYYAAQMNWIVQNRTANNIAFVYGLGDNQQDGNPYQTDGTTLTGNIATTGAPVVTGASNINSVDPVNHDFLAEWKRASADWDILGNANIPYYTVIGNHDYYHWDQKKDPYEFVKYFGAARYAGKSWFGGASPVDKSQPVNLQYAGLNAYTYFTAGGYKFLNIHLQYEGQYPQSGDLAWAQSIINANPGLPTIISTHDYQDNSGRDAAGNFIWNGLVKNNSQIFMVLSGHVNGTHEQVSTDTANDPVLEMLSDYQDFSFSGLQNGGGYLRTLTVDTATNTIHAQTYSPVANNYLTTGTGAAANDFTLSFNFTQRFGPPPLLSGTTYYWDPALTHGTVGGGSGSWSSSTANWSNGSADEPWSIATSNDAADFAGSAGAVTVASGGVSVNDMVFKTAGYNVSGGTITLVGTPSIDTTAGAAVISNVLAGTVGLTVTGGALTLSGANTFTGGLSLTSGANLTFTADANLGAAGKSVSIDGATLTYTGNISNGLTESRAFAIGGNGATFNVPNPGASNGKLVLNALNLLSGAGDITKTGQGWLTVYNSNTGYGGDWNVNGGVLEIGGASSIGTGNIIVNNGGEVGDNAAGAIPNAITLNSGATLGADYYNVSSTGTFSGSITANGSFNVRLGNFYNGQSQKVVLSGSITGSGGLTTVGPAATAINPSAQILNLTGDNSSYSGSINVATGTLVVGATTGRPLGTGTVILSGGKLALQGQAVQAGAVGSINPMAVTGFNKDVIYADPDVGGTTTVGLDGYFSFYQNQFIPSTGSQNAGTQLTGGLSAPAITSAMNNTVYAARGQTVNTPFLLQSFVANNTLQFAQGTTGSLALNVPGAYGNLAILATSTWSNDDTPNVTIYFSDGTSVTTTYKAYDWSMGTDSLRIVASAFGSAGVERYSPTQSPGWDQRPFGLYESDIDLTNINGVDYSYKQIASLTFNATASDAQKRGTTNIFAISGAPRGWVTGSAQSYSNAVNVTADSGIDISGALQVSMSSLTMGACKLSVTSSDTTASSYSLSFSGASLTGAATFDVAASSGGGTGKLILGPTSGSGSLTKSNSGVLELSGVNSFTGSTTINAGTLALDAAASLASTAINVASAATFNVSGTLANNSGLNVSGTVLVNPGSTGAIFNRTVASLTINPGGTVQLLPANSSDGRSVLVTGALSIAGKLDLSNNDLIIRNANPADVINQLKSGYNNPGGYWNGSAGIISSSAATNIGSLTALGYKTGGSAFDGISTSSADLLIKYTWYGDANLDGKVDSSDYTQIDNGFLSHQSTWAGGDFNYDGIVNGSDYTLIDNAFNRQSASLTATVDSPTVQIAAQVAGSTAIPEPAGGILFGAVGLVVLGRRAKHSRRSSAMQN